uniref:Uncharacterized protein n=1 Tax=Oryza meridionalis TaxID=40149 RepID=A0A0E0FD52_9ORYZ
MPATAASAVADAASSKQEKRTGEGEANRHPGAVSDFCQKNVSKPSQRRARRQEHHARHLGASRWIAAGWQIRGPRKEEVGLSGCTALRELYLAWNKISDEGLHWLLKPTWRVPTL